MRKRKSNEKSDAAELRRRWAWVLNCARGISKEKRKFAFEPEATKERLFALIGAELDTRLAEVGEDGLVEDLTLGFMSAEAKRQMVAEMPSYLARERQALLAIPYGRVAVELVDAANAGVRGSPLLSLKFTFDFDDPTLRAIALGFEIESAKTAERAFRKLIAHVVQFLESRYQQYLHVVWALHARSRGAEPPQPPLFGVLLNELSRDVPGLIEVDAVRVRNALIHGHYELAVAEGQLTLWNEVCGKITWPRRTWSLAEFSDFTSRVHGACSALHRALSQFSAQLVLQPRLVELLFAMGDAWRAKDQAGLELLGDEYNALLRSSFALETPAP